MYNRGTREHKWATGGWWKIKIFLIYAASSIKSNPLLEIWALVLLSHVTPNNFENSLLQLSHVKFDPYNLDIQR